MPFETEISSAAQKNNVPLDLFQKALQANSGVDQNFVGMSGEFGVSGVQPQTLIDMGFDPYNPNSNIQGGAAYFRSLFDKFGNWQDATKAFVGDDDLGQTVFQNSTIATDPANAGKSTGGIIDTLKSYLTTENPILYVKQVNQQEALIKHVGLTAIIALVAFSVMSATKGARA